MTSGNSDGNQKGADNAQHSLTLYPEPFRTRVPAEILNMIVHFSSSQARARIVRLNSWFHRGFGKLLYQDVLLETPLQLVNLSRGINAARNLENTYELTIKQSLMADANSWETIDKQLQPAEYLGHVLCMTTSLRVLSVEPMNTTPSADQPAWHLERSFFAELCKQASNPTFLPSLSRLQFSISFFVFPLCKGRPLEHVTSRSLLHLAAINTTRCYHPAGISPTRLLVNFSVPVVFNNTKWSANGLKLYLEECARAGIMIKHLKLVVHYVMGSNQAAANLDTSGWVKMISSTQACGQLESLCLAPEPPLVRYSLVEQMTVVQMAARLIPSLSYVTLWAIDLEWRRCVDEQSDQVVRLPEWSPCPNCSKPVVFTWWIIASGIDIATEVKVAGLEGLAIQMRGIMRSRWSSALVPSVGILQERLLTALAAD
ncbi:hypothetical protein FRC12_004090 [Ceratobasidium sp. 428]|nr:hypothetical protein FRC12_004090 [Ceratobasidium sp. 428]